MTFAKHTLSAIAAISVLLVASTASAVLIDNGIGAGTVGHWSVDVENGGESRLANLTASRFGSGDIYTEDVLYDYFTYVDIGQGAFRLSDTTINSSVSASGNTASSSGQFLGTGGLIFWEVESTIAPGSSIFESRFTFTADDQMGQLDFYQYLDEDIESVSDDVFLTRGSAAGLDLELFTIDNSEVYGVSHSGALDGSQGLENAVFSGWAANQYNQMKPALASGTQTVAINGVIQNLLLFNHPQLGPVYGPRDIVSVMSWSVDPDANSASIITTLGGVPDVTEIPPQAPEPGTAALLILGGVVGLVASRRRT